MCLYVVRCAYVVLSGCVGVCACHVVVVVVVGGVVVAVVDSDPLLLSSSLSLLL